MKPNKEFVEYLYDCRCCKQRKHNQQRIFTSHKRSSDQVIDMFSHVYLEHCVHCGNLAVHDLVALSPEDTPCADA